MDAAPNLAVSTSGPRGDPDGTRLLITAVSAGAARLTLRLAGELDLETRPILGAALCDVDVEHLVLDLREVSFIDSVGLGLLVAAEKRQGMIGGRLVVVVGSEQVRRLLALTGVGERLEIVDQGRAGEPPEVGGIQ